YENTTTFQSHYRLVTIDPSTGARTDLYDVVASSDSGPADLNAPQFSPDGQDIAFETLKRPSDQVPHYEMWDYSLKYAVAARMGFDNPVFTLAWQPVIAPTPTAPVVSTGPASQVAATSAEVTGTVNPEGSATTYHFEYGPTGGYGFSTAEVGLTGATGTTGIAVSA